jgi:hypothetical protein
MDHLLRALTAGCLESFLFFRPRRLTSPLKLHSQKDRLPSMGIRGEWIAGVKSEVGQLLRRARDLIKSLTHSATVH